jgi:lipopolysaccharide transport system permease protein
MTLYSLPEEPLIVIEPRRAWHALDFSELRECGELLYFLTWRDVKVRYKQAVLGIIWALLQPLFLMLVFTIFYGRLALLDTGNVPYSLFAYTGLVLWTLFANAITNSANSLVGNVSLITKVYFPRMLVPAAAVAACLVDFILASILLLAMMIYHRLPLGAHLLMLPVVTALTVGFAFGVGLWMAALNVKYRDIRFLLPFAVQAWLFVSSVILPSTAVPMRWRWFPRLNPMSAFVEAFRAAWFGQPFDWPVIALGAALTLAVLICGLVVFRTMEREFADVI